MDKYFPTKNNIDLINSIKLRCDSINYNYKNIFDDIQVIEDKEFIRESFDGSILTGPIIYYNSSFHRCDFPHTKINNYIFINCDLSHMECTGAIFEECIFINIDCRHTNFTNSRFRGCLILDNDINYSKNQTTVEYSFDKAGLSKTIWESSNTVDTIIANTKFQSSAFRDSLFTNVIFKNFSNYSTSFENAKIINCFMDNFDLEQSSCRGLLLKNTQCDHLTISLPKIPYVIGLEEVLTHHNSAFSITNTVSDNKLIYTNIDTELVSILYNGVSNLLGTNKLFEYINLSYLFLTLSKQQHLSIPEIENKEELSVEVLFQKYILELYSNEAFEISLENFEMCCKFLIYKKINSILIYKELVSIFSDYYQSISDYNYEKYGLCRIFLEEIGKNTYIPNHFHLKILNKSASMQSHLNRQEFEEFFNILINISNFNFSQNKEYIKLIEGSISSQVFIGTPKLIGVSLICVLLGSDISYKDNTFSYNFDSNKFTKNINDISTNIKSNIQELIIETINIVSNEIKTDNSDNTVSFDQKEANYFLTNLTDKKQNELKIVSDYLQKNEVLFSVNYANALSILYRNENLYGFDKLHVTGKNGLLTI
jgi:uncharacterized protein YjbI with pentapeptide repeats